MYDPEITHLLKPLHKVWEANINELDYKDTFKTFHAFWNWVYDLCAWNKEYGYKPIIAFNKEVTDFDWSKCKPKDKDIGKELRRLEKKQFKRKISLSDSIKSKEFDIYRREQKEAYELSLARGELPVYTILKEYFKRTGDTSFNIPQIKNKYELENPRRLDSKIVYINAALDWESGLISKGKVMNGYTEFKDCPRWLKIYNEWWTCENHIYSMEFKDLQPKYTKMKR